MMIWQSCPVCRRAGGAVTIAKCSSAPVQLCSDECAKVYIMRPHKLDFNEKAAALKGGEAAGAYLESIGKTDLASLTAPEWATLCETVFLEACADLRRQADDCIPF